jgi:hypothetical protein
MQIPGNPFPVHPGIARRPQAGASGAEAARTRPKPATSAPRPADKAQAPTQASAPRPAAAGLAKAQRLEQAVQALADTGRLPPRGSLVDFKA